MENQNKEQQQLLDQFAQSALNALISKMPFFDVEGKVGLQVDSNELQVIKKDIAATAYEYASWMIIAREGHKEWLRQNIDINPDFGK